MKRRIWLLRTLAVGFLIGAAVLIGVAHQSQPPIAEPVNIFRANNGGQVPGSATSGLHWSRNLQGPLVDPPSRKPEKAPAIIPMVPPQPVAPPVQLPSGLVLHSILFGGEKQQSLAVFSTGKNKTVSCSAGEIVLGARVVSIDRDCVTLRYRKQDFILSLDRKTCWR